MSGHDDLQAGESRTARSVPSTIMEGLTDAYGIIEEAVGEHGPIERTFLLLSGGNDSMVLLDTCLAYADDVVHINTGIGIPETTEFVRQVCADRGVPLTELHPPIPYRELVLGRWKGFPGPGGHIFTYTMLKERCVRQLLKAHRTKRGQRFALLTGARSGESQRRMGNSEPIRRDGGQVWVNPINNWSNDLMRLYRGVHDLPENEVSKHLHMSGECLCGAFAKPGELEEIRFFYPHVAARIEGLEAEARAAGLKRCQWGWGADRVERTKRIAAAIDQGTLFDEWTPSPLCTTCTTVFADTEREDDEIEVTVGSVSSGSNARGGAAE